MNTALLAIFFSFFASFLNSLAMIFFKISHLKQEVTKKHYLLSWYFISAIFIVGGAAAVSATTLAYADVITLSSISASDLVFNSILANLILKEPFTKYDFISLVLIIIGSLTCLINSAIQPRVLTANDLSNLLLATQALVFLSIAYSLVLIAILSGNRILRSLHDLFNDVQDNSDIVALLKQQQAEQASLINNTENPQKVMSQENSSLRNEESPDRNFEDNQENKQLSLREFIDIISLMKTQMFRKISLTHSKLYVRMPMLFFAWSSGLLSAITTANLKCVAEFFQSEGFLESFSNPLFWSCSILIDFNIIGQLYTLNTALKYYNQLEVIPIYMTSIIINNILCGGIVYNEFSFYQLKQIPIILLGTTICCTGILIVIKKSHFITQDNLKKREENMQNNEIMNQYTEPLIEKGKSEQ